MGQRWVLLLRLQVLAECNYSAAKNRERCWKKNLMPALKSREDRAEPPFDQDSPTRYHVRNN